MEAIDWGGASLKDYFFCCRCTLTRQLACILGLLALCLSSIAVAEQKSIKFNVTPNGYPPYLIVDEKGRASGIMYEVLRSIATELGYTVESKRIPRKRVNQMILSSELDATSRAIEWTQQPERFVFSDEVVAVRDVLFSPIASPLQFEQPQDLFGKSVFAYLGFSYPALEPHLSNGAIDRIDAKSNLVMLQRMLRRPDRFAGALMNESVGLWVIKQQGMKGKFVVSKKAVGEVPYRLMFGKRWAGFVKQFNQRLQQMKADGRLAAILDRYQ